MGGPVRMPEARHRCVLDAPFLAVRQFHSRNGLSFAFARALSACRARPLFAFAGMPAANLARFRPFHFAHAGICPAFFAGFRVYGIPVPLRIVEMMIRFHKVVNREIVLAFKEPGPPADDLFEFDHGPDGAHQHDVPDVPGVHAGGEFVRCGQDGGNGLFVVLERFQMLFPKDAVIGRDTVAVIRVGVGFHPVDEVSDGQGVILGGAKHQGLFFLVDLRHEDFDPLFFPFPDFDDLVEIGFHIDFFRLDLALDQRVVGCVGVFVQGRCDLFHPERGQKTVVDSFPEGIGGHRFAEIRVCVGIVFAFGGAVRPS